MRQRRRGRVLFSVNFENTTTLRVLDGPRIPYNVSELGWMMFLVEVGGSAHFQNWQESPTYGTFRTPGGSGGIMELVAPDYTQD